MGLVKLAPTAYSMEINDNRLLGMINQLNRVLATATSLGIFGNDNCYWELLC